MLKPIHVIPLLVLFMVNPAEQVVAEDKAATLEFRLADDVEAAGLQKMELPGSDKPIYVAGEASLNGSHIEKVSFYKDRNGEPVVGLTLTDDGAKAMDAITSQNRNRRLALVLNGKVVSAPVIRERIAKAVQITGRFDKEDLLAFFHAIVLRELP